ncbi:circularly permuted type 2 ATP-grasp protein [Shimia thalassica]|uniref:circularly permuted type 2 ATP-grasp protein n=1 Tax=Shimia thalassica TaxID=1715693 RepID=UPI0026E40424|nr:circularly permuted type 2 ATP-grasp protein [Shimia thalassica]MDO6479348.1 circularly permuted type 2 ATP-grasp protein [Shimia thalassica]
MPERSPRTPDLIDHDLLATYASQVAGGVAHSDEMLAADGSLHPVWTPFFAHLGNLTPDELSSRFARGDQYLRDAGVLYRQYHETLSSEREWPLSHIPVILGEDEWNDISSGLVERAELLEYVLQDFYGSNELVRSGQLPATLLSQNPAWLRPMVGVCDGETNQLNSLSFEIGRGPDGKWWVISDLIEAPSTAGFAVENRIAMGRVFPNFFGNSNIHRLAGFFKSFQQNLNDLKGRTKGEIALLSPGPMNQNYAEHAYMARYLGLLLVEGEDLIVQDGKAMVRTVAGPKPIGLLWNRLPSSMFDPLELDPKSMLGTPGLVQAVRDGTLKTVNMVGAGVLETRALMAFLPKIARARLGRGLAMSNIATWWCGHAAQRQHVLANSHRMMVGDAFSTTPLMADPATVSLGTAADGASADLLAEMLNTSGRNLVGQEAVTLSTTPTWEDGTLVPRPMCIRISLGRTENGWAVMPGGYARVSAGDDAKALAMQRGGKVADVWVTSTQSVQTPSLLSRETNAPKHGTTHAILPSRAADNLFWVGRYVERSEQNMRLFRAYYARISDGAHHSDRMPAYMRGHLMGHIAPETREMATLFSAPLRLGLQSASRISDRFSPDGMMALRALMQQTDSLDHRPLALGDIPAEVSTLLRQITGFSGLVHENMYRSDGWRFLSLGISLERAANMCALLAASTSKDAPSGALDLALEIGDSVVSHHALFQVWANTSSVIDLLGLDLQNPRSVRYHVSRAKEHIAHLPSQGSGHALTEAARLVLIAETRLATSHPDEITPEFLTQMKQDIWDISNALNDLYLV